MKATIKGPIIADEHVYDRINEITKSSIILTDNKTIYCYFSDEVSVGLMEGIIMALKNDRYIKSDNDDIIVEQWAKAVEMADATIDKRHNSNNVYMSIEVAIIAVFSFINSWWNYALAVVGIMVAIAWFMSVRSYKALSKAKYDIINQIEDLLPVKPFKYEWELIKSNMSYHHVTSFESYLPIVFGFLYVAIIIGLIVTRYSS